MRRSLAESEVYDSIIGRNISFSTPPRIERKNTLEGPLFIGERGQTILDES